MLPYPQIDPVALAIGPLKIHWYGLMYLIGIGAAWLILSRRLNRFDPTWTKEKLSDLVFWVAMGVIVGGRLGYVLFYDLSAYIANPLLILEVWKGGMAFHGGLIGDWPGRRTYRQLHQCRVVGQGQRCAVGNDLSYRSPATGAPSVAALSICAGRCGTVPDPLAVLA